jgi:hypothetical protein
LTELNESLFKIALLLLSLDDLFLTEFLGLVAESGDSAHMLSLIGLLS